MSLMRKLLEDKIAEYPFESQDGLGFDAKCIAHFFVAAAHWFISEMEVTEIGDGKTAWNDLPFIGSVEGEISTDVEVSTEG